MVTEVVHQPVTLGSIANDRLTVTLVRDGSFWSILRNTSGNWDAGVDIELKFDTGQIFAASVSGTDALFDETPATVNALMDDEPSQVTLWYKTATHSIPWARGTVITHDP